MNRTTIITTATLILSIAALGACSIGDDSHDDDESKTEIGTPSVVEAPEAQQVEWNEFDIPLPGGDLHCTWIRTNRAHASIGGPSCDWVGWHAEHDVIEPPAPAPAPTPAPVPSTIGGSPVPEGLDCEEDEAIWYTPAPDGPDTLACIHVDTLAGS